MGMLFSFLDPRLVNLISCKENKWREEWISRIGAISLLFMFRRGRYLFGRLEDWLRIQLRACPRSPFCHFGTDQGAGKGMWWRKETQAVQDHDYDVMNFFCVWYGLGG